MPTLPEIPIKHYVFPIELQIGCIVPSIFVPLLFMPSCDPAIDEGSFPSERVFKMVQSALFLLPKPLKVGSRLFALYLELDVAGGVCKGTGWPSC